MVNIKKVLRVLSIFAYMSFFGTLYTFLKPIALIRNRKLASRARQLNIDAAKNLGCGAESVLVRLPKNGICLHAVEAGPRSGKLVILLHGFPDCWHAWSHIIPAIVKAGYFVVAPDMRGYNLSDKPSGVHNYRINVLVSDIVDLVAYYNKKTAIVVAHDWGGVVAWALAERHPELVEKLVIVNAPHPKAYQRELRKGFDQALSSWYIFFFQIPIIPASVISFTPYESVKTFFKGRKENILTQEDKDVLASSYAQPGAVPAMLNYYKALFRGMVFGTGGRKRIEGEAKRERGEKIKVPTLVLWGDGDVALTRECAQCSEFVQDVRIQYIPKISHWVPYEAPEVVEREVLTFIA